MTYIKNLSEETEPADNDLVWGGKSSEGPGDGRVYTFTTIAAKSKSIIGEVTESLAGLSSASDKTKLNGIATAATANATDEQLRDRSTHTGTQPISTILTLENTLNDYAGRLTSLENTYSKRLYDASGGYILWATSTGLSSTHWAIRRLSDAALASPANNSSVSDAEVAWASRATLVYG